jgi:hypothetical protein
VSTIESLLREYDRFVRLPWDQTVAGPQRVWFAVYDPPQERRLRLRVTEFELATRRAGHAWQLVDLTDAFPQWMLQHRYREQYFARPELLRPVLKRFVDQVSVQLTEALTAPECDGQTMVAVLGIGSLFGLTHTSVVFKDVARAIRGRMLVFFPGQYDGQTYRLLDARDGWNYLAIPITASAGQ